MPASNTSDCFRASIGKKVVGFYERGEYSGVLECTLTKRTLVFDDGTGLTFCSNGAYWLESAEEVRRAIAVVKGELDRTERGLRDVLALAGVVAPEKGAK